MWQLSVSTCFCSLAKFQIKQLIDSNQLDSRWAQKPNFDKLNKCKYLVSLIHTKKQANKTMLKKDQ